MSEITWNSGTGVRSDVRDRETDSFLEKKKRSQSESCFGRVLWLVYSHTSAGWSVLFIHLILAEVALPDDPISRRLLEEQLDSSSSLCADKWRIPACSLMTSKKNRILPLGAEVNWLRWGYSRVCESFTFPKIDLFSSRFT